MRPNPESFLGTEQMRLLTELTDAVSEPTQLYLLHVVNIYRFNNVGPSSYFIVILLFKRYNHSIHVGIGADAKYA